MNLHRSASEGGRSSPPSLAQQLIVLVLFGLGIAGALATRNHWTGPLDVDRLPLASDALEALPGMEAPATMEPAWPDSPRESFSHWESFPFELLLLLGVPLVLLLRSKRTPEAVVNPSAVVAVVLCMFALRGMGNAAGIVAETGNWNSPPFLRWRTSPAEIVPWLWLLAAAAIAALFALWRALRRPTSNGLVLAASALFSVVWTFVLVDSFMLTQMRQHRSSQPASLLLPSVVNERRTGWEWPVTVTMECDHLGACRLLVVDDRDSDEARPREWSGSIDDPALLAEIDEAVAVIATQEDDESWVEFEVFLMVDARLTFGALRPALRRFRTGGVDVFWIHGAPRIEGGLERFVLWTLRDVPPLTPDLALEVQLVVGETAEHVAKLVVKGRHYNSVLASVKDESFLSGDLLQGTVADEVLWRDCTGAVEALEGAVTFRVSR